MRSDGQELFAYFVIGIDHRTGQIIPFVKGCAHWSEHQYNVSHVRAEWRPHPAFLDAQLQQCVAKYCLPPDEIRACIEEQGHDLVDTDSDYSDSDSDMGDGDGAMGDMACQANICLETGGSIGKEYFEQYLAFSLPT